MNLMARDSLRIDSRGKHALSAKITVLAVTPLVESERARARYRAAIDRPRLSMLTAASLTDPLFPNKLRCAAVAPAIMPSRGD